MEEAVCSALPELRHRALGCHLEDEEGGAARVRLETDGDVGMPARLADPADSILASCPVDLLIAAAAATHDEAFSDSSGSQGETGAHSSDQAMDLLLN